MSLDCTEPFATEELEQTCELVGHQEVYWRMAVVLTTMSLCAMTVLAVKLVRRKDLRRHASITIFYPMLIGDLMHAAVYWPYHIFNIMQLREFGIFDVTSNDAWCNGSWFFAAVAIELQFCGLALIAYFPWRLTQNSKRMIFAPQPVARLSYFIALGTAFFIGTLWFVTSFAVGDIDSFQGLYCGPSSWASASGVFLFSSAGIAGSMMIYFYYNSYKTLREFASKHITVTSAASTISSTSAADNNNNNNGNSTSNNNRSSVDTAARNVLKFGLLMIGAFCLTWGPLTVSCIADLFGASLPIEFEMLAGLMTKVKPMIDVFLFFSMPLLRKSKAGDDVQSANDASSDDADQVIVVDVKAAHATESPFRTTE